MTGDVSSTEIAELLGEIRGLGDDPPPEEMARVMARKRALIERIDPDFYYPAGSPPEDWPT